MRRLLLFICAVTLICCKKEVGAILVKTPPKAENRIIRPDKKTDGFASLILHDPRFEKYQLITSGSATSPKYGLKDNKGKLIVDTIYTKTSKLYSNPLQKSKYGMLFENFMFSNAFSICVVTTETGKILTKKWNKELYVLPVPLVYSEKTYYIYSDSLSYGLINSQLDVVLKNNFDLILTSNFAEMAFADAENLKGYCQSLMYPELASINNYEDNHSFESSDDKMSKDPIVNLPKYIFIKKNDKMGVFNMKTLQVQIPCIYSSIYKWKNTQEIIGVDENNKEVVLKLP